MLTVLLLESDEVRPPLAKALYNYMRDKLVGIKDAQFVYNLRVISMCLHRCSHSFHALQDSNPESYTVWRLQANLDVSRAHFRACVNMQVLTFFRALSCRGGLISSLSGYSAMALLSVA